MDDDIIVDATRRIFADLAEPRVVAASRGDGWRAPLWSALETAGLTRAWVPEALGGAGATRRDGFAILRASGRYAAPTPIAETLLGAWLLAEAGLVAPDGPLTLAPVRVGDRLAFDVEDGVSGRVRAAPFASGAFPAAHVVALAARGGGGDVVALLPIAAATARPRIDLGGARADLTFDGARPLAVAPAPSALSIDRLMHLGAVARALQMAGALETLLQATTEHVQHRVAFGRPLAKFQAVQHSLARLAGETAAALTAATSAADAFATAETRGAVAAADLSLEVAAAKIRVGEAAGAGAAIAHQAHGAVGFTREHLAPAFSKALWGWRDDFGPESWWALRLGRATAAAGADALWPALTRR